MKRFLSILLAGTMLLGIVGCGGNTEAPADAENTDTAAEDTADAVENTDDVLVVGLDDTFEPMGFRDENNELVGFDIDLAKAAAEKMGTEIKFQPIDWDSKEMEINTDKIDLIWNGFSTSPEREEAFTLSKPYLDNKQIILVPADSDIATKADLAGKNVGAQDGSTAVDAIEADDIHNEFANLATYDTNVLAFQDLAIGRIDAVVADVVAAQYYIATNEDANLKILDEDFGSEQYVIAAKKGNTELMDKLQAAIDELNADGTSAKISEKWFGEDIVVK